MAASASNGRMCSPNVEKTSAAMAASSELWYLI